MRIPASFPAPAAFSVLALVALPLAFWAEGTPSPTDEPPGLPPSSPAFADPDTPDYYGVIRPLLLQNCMGCHAEEGPGWSMVDPEETFARNRLIASMVTQRQMPPWLAAPGHQAYLGDLSLSDETVRHFEAWRAAGFPRGTPVSDEAHGLHDHGGVGHAHGGHGGPFVPEVSLEVLPGDRFLPNQEDPDDYRCFVVDWEGEEEAWMTGFRALPGNLAVAHHVVIYAVDAHLAPRFHELVAEEAEQPGYQCFGGALPDRLGIRAQREAYEARYPDGVRELSLGNYWLAHWAPGMDGHVFPEGTGIRLEPGAALVVQIHYYAADFPGEYDEGTRVEFQLASEVERPAFHFQQTRGDWLVSERNRTMVIEPGATATYEVRDGMEPLLPYISRLTRVPVERIGALEIHSANLHMHAFGHSGEISLTHPTGAREVLLSVPRWDLRWQRDFTFAEPKVFPRNVLRGVFLTTQCTFQNPTEQVVYGGYGSYDEMCFNFSYIAVRVLPEE